MSSLRFKNHSKNSRLGLPGYIYHDHAWFFVCGAVSIFVGLNHPERLLERLADLRVVLFSFGHCRGGDDLPGFLVQKFRQIQGGPLLVINGVIPPISGLINGYAWGEKTILIGYL